ncbi:MAG TPA: class I SAM-dependent methyltransferase [Urbifossiella sp.]|nr:class I SAM-dependent methyltransferase [Urbifossiella sp.]
MTPDPIRWEAVACPLCGHGGDRDFLRVPGADDREYRLGECPGCGLVFTNPRPDAASIARFYPADYAPYQPPRRRGRVFRRLRERLGLRGERALTDRLTPGGVLLDYGCGSGWFAARMRARGWDARGMDFSPHAAAAARRNFGLDVVHGALPHPAVRPASVDLLTLRAVVEHVHDPRALLRAVFDAVRPGGRAYLVVPNLASWGYRAFGPAWFALDVPRHLLHFTPDTLRRLVEGCGFAVEATGTIGRAKGAGESAARAGRAATWVGRACRLRAARSLFARAAEWAGRGDDLALLARKPDVAAARRAA